MWINEKTLGIFILHSDIRYELWKEGKEAPAILEDAWLAANGYPTLTPVKPTFDPITHKAVPLSPEKSSQGEWILPHVLEALDPIIVANNQQAQAIHARSIIEWRLKDIDMRAVRAMRDIQLGNGDIVTPNRKTPRQILADLETEATTLRAQL